MGAELKITEYSYCKCGAMTVWYNNGEENSVSVTNAEKFIPSRQVHILS